MSQTEDVETSAIAEVRSKLERILGVSDVNITVTHAAGHPFLKLQVGGSAPYFDHAVHAVQLELPADHPLKGRLGTAIVPHARSLNSLEAHCLLTLLTRATRKVAQGVQGDVYSVPYVPFQNAEDHKLAQPASHLIVGRRGVGKSTLISRAVGILRDGRNLAVIIDMQPYAELVGELLLVQVLRDIVDSLIVQTEDLELSTSLSAEIVELRRFRSELDSPKSHAALPAELRRILSRITPATGGGVFVFLDDFHVVRPQEQPALLQNLHGALKGANGWLKVAGLGSLLNHYEPSSRRGLQVPGDAQRISLDLTLENPKAAEQHLELILGNFMRAVGLRAGALPKAPFRRLVWANAGVPRDFLQMFARSLEVARKLGRTSVTLSDVNVAIGEFGQQKIDEMQGDARNDKGELAGVIEFLEQYCLDNHKINAFLVRSDKSAERRLVHVLSDLRLVHLIHQSITPDRAGERYEAFIIDYGLFTGFRRRPNIKELLPDQGDQFKASVLRRLPKLTAGFATAPLEMQAPAQVARPAISESTNKRSKKKGAARMHGSQVSKSTQTKRNRDPLRKTVKKSRKAIKLR